MVAVGRDWFIGTYGAGVLRLNDRGQWETFAGDLRGNVEINAFQRFPDQRQFVFQNPGQVLGRFELLET